MGLSKLSKKIGLKHLAATGVGLFILLLVSIILINLGQPAEGIISNQNDQATIQTPEPIVWLVQKSKFLSFEYPASFSVLQSAKPAGIELENFNYVRQTYPFWFLSVGVSTLLSGNLKDNGSYNMRSQPSSHYKSEAWEINGSQVTIFTDQSGGYDKAAFIAHNGRVLSVDVNSADSPNSDKLDAILKKVLESISWSS